MFVKRQFFYASALVFLLILLCRQTLAEQLTSSDNAINNLYENLLQREYAGPVVFPNHQVERKAQRSPSLRLRFGRRTDPDMMALPSAEKRWWGDVNQKPIRSPSLRLRFGKRSNYDGLLNDLAMNENAAAGLDDYSGGYEAFEREARKPQRLRWGRSAPFEGQNNGLSEMEDEREREHRRLQTESFYNALMSSDKLRNIVLALQQYEEPSSNFGEDATESENDEFQREVRKPTPLRLRWGRSTGRVGAINKAIAGSQSNTAVGGSELQQKKSSSQNVVLTPKQHAQPKN